MLGYPCYHMAEVAKHPGHDEAWRAAARDQAAGRVTDWRALFGPGGYTAAVDWPAARFYKELLAAYPGAKVILTVRESFDAWYASVCESIYPSSMNGLTVRPPPWLAHWFRNYTSHYSMVDEVIWTGTFDGRFKDREFARQVYESHIAEVKRLVPPSQLLVFSARQGWGPLCAFLGRQPPPPDTPFPNVNDKADFAKGLGARQRRARHYRNIILASNAALAAALAAGAALAVRLLRGGGGGAGRRSGGKTGAGSKGASTVAAAQPKTR
ncbi:hypothetical protein HYH02_005783 [Chlamydomonas schloesseri]|uniref:Sulfotransferase n=1 Tax=Chlamydomonas schloesseri TaxID=2026947 RepID=A0A836B6G1_9CHLO|nr:hypothetical protein HYH02_005783 [Chlamydomonas schloesseri]|eukprot:KAG2449031.1 hypothetical protein HYH02_005783 [Chlamydomonas schloesseri]